MRGYATSSWTLPTHASLFTGKLPSAHGAVPAPDGPLRLTDAIAGDASWSEYRVRTIAAEEETLARVLRRRGWRTGAVVGGPWMKRVFALDQGFESYDDRGIDELDGRKADSVTEGALAFLDEVGDEPFFLFLNYYDPHNPLTAPLDSVRAVLRPGEDPKSMGPRERLTLAYDAEVRFMDQHFGRLLDALRERGLYEDAWIVVTADHGELLGEELFGGEGLWGHGRSLSEPELRVPLIVKRPGKSRRGRDDAPVSQIDVLPTLLAELGLDLPPAVQGEPIGRVRHPVFAELRPLPHGSEGPSDWRNEGSWSVIYDATHKFGVSDRGRTFLVDLKADPSESTDLGSLEPELAARLRARIDALLASLPSPGPSAASGTVDRSTRQALESLGYVEPGRR